MHPSSTDPDEASSSAAATSRSVIGNIPTSESHESSHSVTQGMTASSPAPASRDPIHFTADSYTPPISIDEVSRIGLSRIPHSRIVLMPISSP